MKNFRDFMKIEDYRLNPPEDTRKLVYKCKLCGWGIYEGDDYYYIPDVGEICETCIDEAKRYDAVYEE